MLFSSLSALQIASSYVAMLAVFLAVDALWLSQIALKRYQGFIGHLMTDKVNFGAAAIFYLLYLIGVLIFAVAPAVEKGSWLQAGVLGFLFGLFAYMTYNMTNYATLRDYPFAMVAMDVSWGATLTGLVALGGYAAARAVGS